MFGDFSKIMQNVRDMGARMKETQEQLRSKVVSAEAGGGMVTARMSGTGELVGLEIEKDVIDPEDPELLADLVLAAVNNARKKAENLRTEAIRDVTGGVDISGLGIDLNSML